MTPIRESMKNGKISGDWAMMTKQQETKWRTAEVKRVISNSFLGVLTCSDVRSIARGNSMNGLLWCLWCM